MMPDHQMKNCDKAPKCMTCAMPKLDADIFQCLFPIPQPEPALNRSPLEPLKYASFLELYRKEQPDKYKFVPSILQGPENVDG